MHDFPCFYALQETDNRTTSAIPFLDTLHKVVTTEEHPILRPREVDHFRRERCTAVGSAVVLSVYLPHSGHDEEDYIEALETVRATLTDGKKAGAVDFSVGGNIDIELMLGNAGEDLQGLDSIEWNGMYWPEGGGEEVITYEKKIRWLQLLKELSCTVTSTWTKNDDN